MWTCIQTDKETDKERGGSTYRYHVCFWICSNCNTKKGGNKHERLFQLHVKQTRRFHLKASFRGCWGSTRSSFHTWWFFTDLNTYMEDKWNFYSWRWARYQTSHSCQCWTQNGIKIKSSRTRSIFFANITHKPVLSDIQVYYVCSMCPFIRLHRFFLAQNGSLEGGTMHDGKRDGSAYRSGCAMQASFTFSSFNSCLRGFY